MNRIIYSLMQHFLIIVVLLTRHFIGVAMADELVDWSPFEVQSFVDGQENLDIVKKLPIQQYWDVQKGSFRSGLIGETISDSFPQFVSLVERKVMRGGKTLGADSHVVDTASLFMCSLSAVQTLIGTESQLSAKHRTYMYPRMDNFIRADGSFGDSLEDLEMQQLVLQLQSANIQQLVTNFIHHQSSASKLLDTRRLRKLDHLSDVHADLLGALTTHLSALNSSRTEKFSELLDMAQSAELSRRLQKQEFLLTQHEADTRALRQTINITMQAVAFRAAAELSAAQAQRAFEEGQLLATRTELLQAEVETLINTFFEEMYTYAIYVQANPAVAALVLRNALLGVFLILLVFEVGNLIQLVYKKLSVHSYLPKVVRLNGSTASRSRSVGDGVGSSPTLAWAPSVDQQLRRALTAMSVATEHRLPLPNLLVSGPAGSGKSSMSQAILQHIAQAATSSGAPVSSLLLCGADLQALGNGAATGFLNDLIGSFSRQGRQRGESLVLVIDDADCIVAARGRQGTKTTDNSVGVPSDADISLGSNSNGSLFALLTGLRENSPFVSVVMTVRLPVRSLDTAVLDRLDHCIELALPSSEQRLLYLLDGLAALKRKTPAGSSRLAAEKLEQLSEETKKDQWGDWDIIDATLSRPSLSSEGSVIGKSSSRTGRIVAVAALLRRLNEEVDLEQIWGSHSHHPLQQQWQRGGGGRSLLVPPTMSAPVPVPVAEASTSNNNSNSNNNADNGSCCPEMDLPDEDRLSATAAATAIEGPVMHGMMDAFESVAVSLTLLRACAARAPAESFQVLPCLKLALLVSAGWSYRDLKQLISALNYTILCSDRCRISNRIWLQELIYALE